MGQHDAVIRRGQPVPASVSVSVPGSKGTTIRSEHRLGNGDGNGNGSGRGGASMIPAPERDQTFGSSFSMAATSAGSSGSTEGPKRATTWPSASTRNLVKFHLISPRMPSAVCSVKVR